MVKAPRTSAKGGNVTHVGNKAKRQELVRAYKKEKNKEKLLRRKTQAKEEVLGGEEGARKKAQRLAKNVPRTIENTREFNPTILNAPNTHPGRGPTNAVASTSAMTLDSGDEGRSDEDEEERQSEDDEAAKQDGAAEDADAEGVDADADEYDDASDIEDGAEDVEDSDVDMDPHAPPALLITTALPHNATSPHLNSLNARSHPFERTRQFIKELLNVFPGAEYRSRAKAKGVGLGKIAGWARKRGYNGMVVIGEDASSKLPVYLTIIGLPKGPTAFFRLTSISIGKEIYGHARPTPHTPELILNNFTTTLGHTVGGVFQSLFPKIPQLEGRQVVTAHNQRDYIFFRRHRYMFASQDKAKLQEIGPRFTLKLRSLKKGLPKGAGQWDGIVDFDGTGECVDPKGEKADEAEALREMDVGESASATSKVKKAQRGDEVVDGLEFEWKPKMSVSRRNFYL
ncbi:Brix-domain-containing protein [Tilletiaria anomala UBC 951]|uniref:Brix-domain-containing protein n=1 Tax=Tilletiaria anomala (strain ATCC 24038 / CBS 436.72 / UBC 951) TaxID=1037660 RepID=A0A066VF53_TILAU|nr:Brix-domain-containing protein [Tilletiaria anomala UBC 951]KDN38928.1 Brix-domain-containing protein [Tilletiaria anomala UBC 951]